MTYVFEPAQVSPTSHAYRPHAAKLISNTAYKPTTSPRRLLRVGGTSASAAVRFIPKRAKLYAGAIPQSSWPTRCGLRYLIPPACLSSRCVHFVVANLELQRS